MPEEIPMLPEEGSEAEATTADVGKTAAKFEEPRTKGPSPRQTLGYLRGLLQSYGIEPKSKLGQNFLIDLNLHDLIVRVAELDRSDTVLEVGSGTGALTSRIAEVAGSVFSVEIDADVQQVADQIIGHQPHVRLFLGDCLERKNELNPEMLAAWTAHANQYRFQRRKLVANLPYVIATPLISNLLLTDIDIERMVVMVQWEIAERLRAEVGTKDYNALSVLVQSVADVEIVRKVLPSNFFPRPKVDSAIVMIKPNASKRADVGDVQAFRAFLRDLYVHRRKNLRAGLAAWPQGRRDKADVDARLQKLGIDGNRRAETLTLEEHLRLSREFR